MGTLANSEDPDEMPHNAASHQGLHCLLRLKQSLGTKMHHNLKNLSSNPLRYRMGKSYPSFNVYGRIHLTMYEQDRRGIYFHDILFGQCFF